MKKFRKLTSFISFILTLSILLCFFAGCDLVLDPPEDGTVAADVGKPTEKVSEKSLETDEFGETKLQKEYCTATIDEDFSEYCLYIELFPEYENVEYTIEDFADVGCTEIIEHWRAKDDHTRNLKLMLNKDSKKNVLAMIKELEKREDVYRAYPDYYDSPTAIPSGYNSQTSIQWAIEKLQLPDAWDINTGSDTIYVGVIDSGIDIEHPDLRGRVDTALSANFSEYNTALDDATGHGTLVAGIIGAQWDSQFQSTSGKGGVCWNVKLVSLRVAKRNGKFSHDSVAQAINYAEENGIKILNYSGGSYSQNSNLREALYSYSGIFICGAGNDSLNNDNNYFYPASYSFDNIVSVGASTSTDGVWSTTDVNDDGYYSGSNYGATSVDLFAPGVGIYSCYLPTYGYYVSKSGTSMAAPFVTGVAALMLAENPSLTPAQIKAALMSSVDQMSAFSGKCVSGGRLNAYEALKAVHTHSYAFSYTSSLHTYACRCGDSTTDVHMFTYTCLNNDSDTHKATCYCGYSVTEAHTYKITSSTVSCTQCSYSHSHSHAVSYTSIGSLSHKATCDCGAVAYEAHDKITTGSNVSRCSKCGYGIELWSVDLPVTSQKYTLDEYK